MSESYKATSPKNPDTNYTQEVILEKDNSGNVTKSISVGGEPVELSEEQLATARKYLNVRTASDDEVKAAQGDPNDEVDDKTEDQLAFEDQTSTVPKLPAEQKDNAAAGNDPAASQAREARGKGGAK